MSNQAIVLLPLPPHFQSDRHTYLQLPLWENGLPNQAGWDLYRSVPRLIEMVEASAYLGSLVTAEDPGLPLTLQNDVAYRQFVHTTMFPRAIDARSVSQLLWFIGRGDLYSVRQHEWSTYDLGQKISGGYALNVERLDYTDALQIAEGTPQTTWYTSDMAVPSIALFEKVYFWHREQQMWFVRCLDELGQMWMVPLWLYFSYQYGRSDNPYWREMTTRLWKFYPSAYASDKLMALQICGEVQSESADSEDITT